jgi:hypothetical protein
MKKYIFTAIIILWGLSSFAQDETYLDGLFIKDMNSLKKESCRKLKKTCKSCVYLVKPWERAAYKNLKNTGLYKKDDSLQIIFIYRFKEFYFDKCEIYNNQYLYKIKPEYSYSRFLLFSFFRNKIPTKKRLCADGYVLNNNKLVATITSANGYPFYINPFSYSNSCGNIYLLQHNDEQINLVKNVLIQNYDLCFYLGLMGYDTVWCIKGNKTWIYDVKQQKTFTLEEWKMKNNGKI